MAISHPTHRTYARAWIAMDVIAVQIVSVMKRILRFMPFMMSSLSFLA